MKSREEIKRALNKINVKIQLAPHNISGWDIIRLYSDYPYEDICDYANSLKEKLPRSVLVSPMMIREIADFLGSPDVNLRALAEHILKEIDNEESRNALTPKALNLRWISSPDLDPYILAEAARYLGEIGEPESVGPLIKVLSHPNRAVRGNAAQALGKIGDDRAVPYLLKALEDTDIFVREKAAAAILKFPDKEIIKPLVKAYKENLINGDVSHTRLRKHCSQGLMKIGLPAAIVLNDIIHEEQNPNVKIWAVTLLLIMGLIPVQEFLEITTKMDMDKNIHLIHQVFRDLQVEVPAYKGYFIPLIKGTRNQEFLKLVVFARDDDLKKMALNRIYQLSKNVFDDVFGEVMLCNWPADRELYLKLGDKIIPAIKKLLGRCGPHVRVNCLQLLGEMGNLKGIKLVEEQLQDSESEVRKEALQVVLKAGGNVTEIPLDCVSELVELIGTAVEDKALQFIKKQGDMVYPVFRENLAGKSEEYLCKLVCVLETLGGHKAVALLVKIWRQYRNKVPGSMADESLRRLGKNSLISRIFLLRV